MFSKDSNHYRPTPRSLQQSKFGAYAKLQPVGHRPCIWCAIIAAAGIAAILFGCLLLGVGR